MLDADQIMLMTDKAKLIRTPVKDIRIAGRNTQGVTILRTAEAERVMSATVVKEDEGQEGDDIDMDETLDAEVTSNE